MVEKKLNFNQPILSVRRNSPSKNGNAHPIINWVPPPNLSETKSGPVRNPGSVPFLWERSPGTPKEEILAQCRDSKADQPHSHPVSSKQTSEESMRSCSEDSNEAANAAKPINLPDFSEYFAAKREENKGEQRRKVVNQDKPVLLHCKPDFEKSCVFHHKEEKEGSDHQHENVINICCSLPRSFMKSSVCNVNPATSVMNRVMTFPASRMFSGISSISRPDSENLDKNCTSKEENNSLNKPLFLEVVKKHPSGRKSFKTLQELLADEGGLKWLDCAEKTIYADAVKKVEHDRERDNIKTCDEMSVSDDLDQDSSSEEDIIRVQEAAKNAKQQLARAATLGNVSVVPPPLPESPSDSWLSRTVSKKALRSVSMSRFSNKY